MMYSVVQIFYFLTEYYLFSVLSKIIDLKTKKLQDLMDVMQRMALDMRKRWEDGEKTIIEIQVTYNWA